MDLTDNIWKSLEGGYKITYDASIPLRQFEITNDPSIVIEIWKELWDELHHQGDVGLASYLSIPQIVRICKLKGIYDWNLLGLACVIEQQRHLEKNPKLPDEFAEYYNNGLIDLKNYVLDNINKSLDRRVTFQLVTKQT